MVTSGSTSLQHWVSRGKASHLPGCPESRQDAAAQVRAQNGDSDPFKLFRWGFAACCLCTAAWQHSWLGRGLILAAVRVPGFQDRLQHVIVAHGEICVGVGAFSSVAPAACDKACPHGAHIDQTTDMPSSQASTRAASLRGSHACGRMYMCNKRAGTVKGMGDV